MGVVEEQEAFTLICNQFGSIAKGRKLKIGIDIDDTAADVASVMLPVLAQRHGVAASKLRNRYDLSDLGITRKQYLDIYTELWNAKHTEIRPLLSRRAFMMLSEIAGPVFVTARSSNTHDALRSWLERNYGKQAKVNVLPADPHEAQGSRKLGAGFDLLIDDAPHIAASMGSRLAQGKALLLVDKWKEARALRNKENTAIVASAEHAADLIFEAHELTE